MKSLVVTVLLFIGFLKEKHIKQDYKDYIHIKYYTVSRLVCPVTVDSYVETSNDLFVQEKPKPIALLIPEDLRCDGLLCPIPPREREIKRPDLDLRNLIIWDFLHIVQYIQLLKTPTNNNSSITEELLNVLSLESFVVLLDLFCLYWYNKESSTKKKESDEENEDEEAEQIRESTMSMPGDYTYVYPYKHQESKYKKKRLGFNVRKSFCHFPKKTRKNGTERKELSRLFLNFIRKSF